MNFQTFAISIFLFSLFFIDGPGEDAARSFKAFWDLGHIIVFALWSYLLLKGLKVLAGLRFLKQAALLLVFMFIMGTSIELIQYRFHRTPSVDDVVRDIIGTLATLAFLVPQRDALSKNILRIFQIFTALLVIGALLPFAGAVTDEYIAGKIFPVLSNFENPLEMSRWECKTGCSIVKGVALDGGGSLKVPLETTLYSGISLKYFPHDWRGYSFLSFNIFNESDEPLKIACRIHDKEHEASGYAYNDRYTVKVTLNPGWNSIRIPLSDVASAPRERKMDMAEIRSVGVFVTRLKKEMNIYIDDLALTN